MARFADFSGTPPGAAALKDAGFVGVIRYIGLGSEGKQIHRAEWEDYLRHGLQVLLVAELGVDDAWAALDDYATGAARAKLAMADTRAECPAGVDPTRVLIGCAADAHASSATQITDAVRYSSGFASVLGLWRSGFYGFVETSRAVHTANAAGWHWRCGSEPTVEDKRWLNFWQRNKAPTTMVVNHTVCDINETLAALPVGKSGPATRKRPQAMIVVTCIEPNHAGILEGGRLWDITGDPTARDFAQTAIGAGTAAELRVTAATWDDFAAASAPAGPTGSVVLRPTGEITVKAEPA